MGKMVWVTGASSGIGAAFVDATPDRFTRVVGISRRPHPRAEHLAADLGDPASWKELERHLGEELAAGDVEEALFFHCAGTLDADGPLVDADPDAYTHAVLLNAAAGQVLGRAFLAAAIRARIAATTFAMCSSPAASNPLAGMSHYCGGKAALEHWTRAVGVELGDGPGVPRVLSIVPHAVDTPMVRGVMERPAEDLPLADFFREAATEQALATPERVAREIWDAIDRGVPQGAALAVGAVPEA